MLQHPISIHRPSLATPPGTRMYRPSKAMAHTECRRA